MQRMTKLYATHDKIVCNAWQLTGFSSNSNLIYVIPCNSLHSKKQCNSTQFKSFQLISVGWNTIQFGCVQFNSVSCHPTNATQWEIMHFTALQKTMQLNFKQLNAMHFNATQCNSMHWKSMVFNSVRNNSVKFYAHQSSSIKKNIRKWLNPVQYNSMQNSSSKHANGLCSWFSQRGRGGLISNFLAYTLAIRVQKNTTCFTGGSVLCKEVVHRVPQEFQIFPSNDLRPLLAPEPNTVPHSVFSISWQRRHGIDWEKFVTNCQNWTIVLGINNDKRIPLDIELSRSCFPILLFCTYVFHGFTKARRLATTMCSRGKQRCEESEFE